MSEAFWVLGVSYPLYDGTREYIAIGPFSELKTAEESLTYMASRPTVAKATVKPADQVPAKYRPLIQDWPIEHAADATRKRARPDSDPAPGLLEQLSV